MLPTPYSRPSAAQTLSMRTNHHISSGCCANIGLWRCSRVGISPLRYITRANALVRKFREMALLVQGTWTANFERLWLTEIAFRSGLVQEILTVGLGDTLYYTSRRVALCLLSVTSTSNFNSNCIRSFRYCFLFAATFCFFPLELSESVPVATRRHFMTASLTFPHRNN